MKAINNVRELDRALWCYDRLREIARGLHRQDENACNYGLSKGQETRVRNLEKKAQDIAQEMDLVLYRQGDPRGCPLYLLENIEDKDSYNTKGIAVCN